MTQEVSLAFQREEPRSILVYSPWDLLAELERGFLQALRFSPVTTN